MGWENIRKYIINWVGKLIIHTVPNSFIHTSYFFISSLPTDLFTFFKAYKKSYFVNGTFTSSSNFFISSIFLNPPAFFNLLLIGI